MGVFGKRLDLIFIIRHSKIHMMGFSIHGVMTLFCQRCTGDNVETALIGTKYDFRLFLVCKDCYETMDHDAIISMFGTYIKISNTRPNRPTSYQ